MYIGTHAARTPDKPAIIMAASGEVVTYAELYARVNRLAWFWWNQGLRRGDHVAVLMYNDVRYLEAVWAALCSGLYVTPINSHLTAGEVAHLLADSDSRCLVTARAIERVALSAVAKTPSVEVVLLVGGESDAGSAGSAAGDGRFVRYEDAVAEMPASPLDSEPAGELMFYSSGTTGLPKGVKRSLRDQVASESQIVEALLGGVFGLGAEDVYLSPAPLYHAAPLGFCVGVQTLGGTVVIMEKFDAAKALEVIERYAVTAAQWVPTMFIHLLKLPDQQRRAADVSSLRLAVHSGAPCSVEVKQQMMEWWGPILWEYYAGTELNGYCLVRPEEWLERPGTVGRPLFGEVHILGDTGEELAPGQDGTVYFAGGPSFEYHNDPTKTLEARDPAGHGWTTLGDIGHVDEEGWLYLTDRRAFMIVSGGVNIYPQEVENVLALHPKVADVAVIGVPSREMGEDVKAVVQPAPSIEPGPDLAQELLLYCRERLAHHKCPRTIDFDHELPRLPTGKLYKTLLRDRYWAGHSTRII